VARAPTDHPIACALRYSFVSPNEFDSNLEATNIVDVLYVHARAVHRLAAALERIGGHEEEETGDE
jgi:hypothetical protein